MQNDFPDKLRSSFRRLREQPDSEHVMSEIEKLCSEYESQIKRQGSVQFLPNTKEDNTENMFNFGGDLIESAYEYRNICLKYNELKKSLESDPRKNSTFIMP